MKTKKGRRLLPHTAANPPPTLPFSEQRSPLPARSDEKERWKKEKISWQGVPRQFSRRWPQGVKPGPGFGLPKHQSSGRRAEARLSSPTLLIFPSLQRDQGNHRIVGAGRDLRRSSGPNPCQSKFPREKFPSFMLLQVARCQLQSISQS